VAIHETSRENGRYCLPPPGPGTLARLHPARFIPLATTRLNPYNISMPVTRKQPLGVSEAQITQAALDISRLYTQSDLELILTDKVLPDGWGRSRVWRYHVEKARAGFPETLIVKISKIGGGHIFNEWASLQFLNQFASLRSLVPAFYGGNEDLELLVLEDLGAVRGENDLGTILEGEDAALARDALLAHARNMALLHTTTAGFEQEFNTLRGKFPAYDRPISKDQFGDHFAWFLRTVPRFDLDVSRQLEQEAQTIIATLRKPNAPRAYTRGDVCPSNIAYSSQKTRFYDFEMGAFRHVLLSAAYFRISHLSCFNGSLIPLEVQAEAEQAYFQAVAPLIPDPGAYQTDSAAAATAMLIWILSTSLEKALQKDRPRHLATLRQRIFAALTLYTYHEIFSTAFSQTAEILNALRQKLDVQWAEEEKTIPIFTAFQNSP